MSVRMFAGAARHAHGARPVGGEVGLRRDTLPAMSSGVPLVAAPSLLLCPSGAPVHASRSETTPSASPTPVGPATP